MGYISSLTLKRDTKLLALTTIKRQNNYRRIALIDFYTILKVSYYLVSKHISIEPFSIVQDIFVLIKDHHIKVYNNLKKLLGDGHLDTVSVL